jgi:late competence protein required for DNA uptake (superfamily II DNA/RNA helicase)
VGDIVSPTFFYKGVNFMAENKTKKRVTTKKVVTQSVEDRLLGVEPTVEVVKVVSYESPERKYRVTALHEGATPVLVNGTVIEAFIGSTNKNIREALIAGAKEVITKDGNGKDAYKIEVL